MLILRNCVCDEDAVWQNRVVVDWLYCVVS